MYVQLGREKNTLEKRSYAGFPFKKERRTSYLYLIIISVRNYYSNSRIWYNIDTNCLLRQRKKIAKFLMRTFTCRSTFLIFYISHYLTLKPSQCRGKITEWYGEGPRFKSPVCTQELSAMVVARIIFLGGGGVIILRYKGNFPQHFGICEISHISREFSHQCMEKFQRKFNLHARMKLLLNKYTWESHFSFATVQVGLNQGVVLFNPVLCCTGSGCCTV